MQHPFILASTAAALLLTSPAFAQQSINSVVTTHQTVNDNTLTITNSGGVHTTGSTHAVTMTGPSATVENSGSIRQTGSRRAIRMNDNGNYLIRNHGTGSIYSLNENGIHATGDASAADVTIENTGLISADDARAIDLENITSIASETTIINHADGIIRANASDAIRTAVGTALTNYGLIEALPIIDPAEPGVKLKGSDGIDMRNNSGLVVENYGTIRGRHGITGGNEPENGNPGYAVTITVTNHVDGVISAVNGSSLNIDFRDSHLNLTNHGLLTGTYDTVLAPDAGDGDGVDVDGTINLENYGIIRGLGAKGDNSVEGLAAGGGTIINHAGAEISGNNTVGDTSLDANGILIDNSDRGPAYAPTTVDNAGMIRGYNGFGIGIISEHDNEIINRAGGTIQATTPAIQTGSGDDTVENHGAIIGVAGTEAINLGGGNNRFEIKGGAATVVGDINGGSGGSNHFNIAPGAGETFEYEGMISNFDEVVIESGTVVLSGASLYTGETTVEAGATLRVENATGSATGSGLVAVAGTLEGDGTIAGDVAIRNGGTLLSGHATSLTLASDLLLEDGAHLAFNLDTPIVIEGLLIFTGEGSISIDLYGSDWSIGTTTLLEFDGFTNVDLSRFTLGVTPNGFDGRFNLSDNRLNLEIAAIPEPTSLVWFGAFALGGVHYLRRRFAA